MKFKAGQLVMTRGVNDLVADDDEFAKHVQLSIRRHLSGDWGEVCDEDRAANESAQQHGERLFSVYQKKGVPKIWDHHRMESLLHHDTLPRRILTVPTAHAT